MNLKEILKEKITKRKAITDRLSEAKTNNELDEIEVELRKFDLEINDLKNQIKESDSLPPEARNINGNIPKGDINCIASFKNHEQVSEEDIDIYGTLEYRKAFKDYILRGVPIPQKYVEKRADTLTTVSDIGAVIPTTIQNQVIKDITVEGKILSRVNQTAYQGGIQIPISEINITATWIESENFVSDEQKAEMNAKISFGYFPLEARVAVGLLSATVSLPIFEANVIKQLKKAMVKELETVIVKGTGSGQPLGFTKYNLPENQVITMTEKEISTVSAWAAVEAAIPEAYEDTVIYVMSKATWELYLNGMTDKNGQKIGLGKINERGQKILNGREVLTVDNFPSFSSAANGTIWGAVVDLSQYCLNSNLAMYYKKYFNEDKNKWIHKAIMIADGKMAIGEIGENDSKRLVGAGGLIYLKK